MAIHFKEYLDRNKLSSIKEARFLAGSLEKAAKNIAILIGKGLGTSTFKKLGGELGKEKFIKSSVGSGEGFKFMNSEGDMVRVGFVKTKTSNSGELNAIDFWSHTGNRKYNKPDVSIVIPNFMNIVQSLKFIVDALKGNDSSVFTESNSTFNDLNSKIKNKKFTNYLMFKMEQGYIPSKEFSSSKTYMTDMINQGYWDDAEYKSGSFDTNMTETNSTVEILTKADKELVNTKFADPDVVFDDIEKLTQVVAGGFQNSLLIVGMAKK
jgi:hypothetical protein